MTLTYRHASAFLLVACFLSTQAVLWFPPEGDLFSGSLAAIITWLKHQYSSGTKVPSTSDLEIALIIYGKNLVLLFSFLIYAAFRLGKWVSDTRQRLDDRTDLAMVRNFGLVCIFLGLFILEETAPFRLLPLDPNAWYFRVRVGSLAAYGHVMDVVIAAVLVCFSMGLSLALAARRRPA